MGMKVYSCYTGLVYEQPSLLINAALIVVLISYSREFVGILIEDLHVDS